MVHQTGNGSLMNSIVVNESVHKNPGLQPQQWRTLIEDDPWEGYDLYAHNCYKASSCLSDDTE